ncbi:LTA synthase family protein [Ferdinandcohnia quinoae]|uniref:LTA synthase family protein n=1 Tax=Fredinandcohnia quinoae TaxID=2918902 RepID=A0AAW5DY94_9BACI|nr:LTA synthase family protein [Fredinandcohnia sp. SECRCQ15]MCH1625607.1 LTA synthase family protein [Fredinandcohnia sp. SECRCQ15]
MKKLKSNQHPLFFFVIIIFLFTLKTYIAYRIEFNLDIKNGIQQFLLAINPISSAILFFGIAFLFNGKNRHLVVCIIHLLLSLILYANIMYHRFFNDFITLPVLFQTKNFGDLGDSAIALFRPNDIFYFSDIILIGFIFLSGMMSLKESIAKKTIMKVFLSGIFVLMINIALAEKDRPELLTRSFDRNYLVKYLGTYNFQIYDAIQTVKSSSQRVNADGDDITEIENYVKANFNTRNQEYFGKAKGMNVIYVSLESFQTFMIDYKLNGQEVTPFLNRLVHDKNTFYFDNFFHQTGQGKTSDAEFMMENALFPLPQGAVFMTKAQNTYQALPAILKGQGYTSASFHGNYKSFWNREQMYKSLGYENFFDGEFYTMSDENTINYGMKDKPFFAESMPLLEGLQEPFYAKFISLSNHFPFPLDEEDVTFPAGDFGDTAVNQYFQTAHYMDEALQQFFEDLKAKGLYDRTVIVLYGDHYGISENHHKAMAKVLGTEITPFENAQLQRTPLYIHVPGTEGKIVHTYGGQVDIRPTVLHLLGIETNEYITFGSDLLAVDREQTVPFRNGDFVTKDFTFIKGVCYVNETGVEIDNRSCDSINEVVKTMLDLSDKVVYGDLLRFYHPSGFTPVDRTTLDYSKIDVIQKDLIQ